MSFILKRIRPKPLKLFEKYTRNYGNLLSLFETGQDGTPPPPPPPQFSFTSNWSVSGTTVSVSISNIQNEDGETLTLTSSDGTVLASQVVSTATNFTLSYNQNAYGTFVYNLRKAGVIDSSFTATYSPATPTYDTPTWSASDLTVSVNITNIQNAHSDFTFYLTDNNDVVLQSIQLQSGTTSISLSHTETTYDTHSYKLKLNTSVVATTSQTLTRPVPTYNAAFSINDLTLTAAISAITNAHNSFSITLHRDDANDTVLQTQVLASGTTSFNFTHTETAYGTYDYLVKINGSQTHTYSATYSVPPTPTFTVALSNNDLALTLVFTNITNPHSYYTLTVHDASSQLASHTFASTDTSVNLTWNETTYGSKSYTVKLNGIVSSTHTITLTDSSQTMDYTVPNPIGSNTPSYLLSTDGDWSGYHIWHVSSSNNIHTFALGNAVQNFGNPTSYFEFDDSTYTWQDASIGTGDPTQFQTNSGPIAATTTVSSNSDIVKLHGSVAFLGSFTIAGLTS